MRCKHLAGSVVLGHSILPPSRLAVWVYTAVQKLDIENHTAEPTKNNTKNFSVWCSNYPQKRFLAHFLCHQIFGASETRVTSSHLLHNPGRSDVPIMDTDTTVVTWFLFTKEYIALNRKYWEKYDGHLGSVQECFITRIDQIYSNVTPFKSNIHSLALILYAEVKTAIWTSVSLVRV